MSFQAGDVVVCISVEANPNCQPNFKVVSRLKKGALYRVGRYYPVSSGTTYWNTKPIAGVQLVGIDHSPGHGWQAWRFRKLVAADPDFTEYVQSIEPERVSDTFTSTKFVFPAEELR